MGRNLEARLRRIEKANPAPGSDEEYRQFPEEQKRILTVSMVDAILHEAAMIGHARGQTFTTHGQTGEVDPIRNKNIADSPDASQLWAAGDVASDLVTNALREGGTAAAKAEAARLRAEQRECRIKAGAPVRLLGVAYP